MGCEVGSKVVEPEVVLGRSFEFLVGHLGQQFGPFRVSGHSHHFSFYISNEEQLVMVRYAGTFSPAGWRGPTPKPR